MRWIFVLCIAGIMTFSLSSLSKAEHHEYDLVVYGGTSAAVVSAVQAVNMGRSVVVVSPDIHLGGLSSGGLGWTDSGDKSVIGGLSRQFYHRIWLHYDQDDAWEWQDRESYGNRGQGHPAIDQDERTMWIFEPHVAEKVFDEWVEEKGILVIRDAWLDRENGVEMEGDRIKSITTLDGQTFRGRMFIDATYEGDLMAAAGVTYHVGREGNDVYDETWNGVQTGVYHHRHHFMVLDEPISPYRIPDDPESGLLPRISPDPPGEKGNGDHRVQAYCFRMCLTNHPENRVPFPQPEGYDPDQYLLLLRIFDAGWRETFWKFDPIPNRKTDTNNHGPFSTDNIGYNYDYPEASYERRREIIEEHKTYQQGLMWFIANDPRVPEDVQSRMSEWGLAKDEFVDNGHWPHQLYIREARRMIGEFVMTENELLKRTPTPDSVGMGSYTIDSHNTQRHVAIDPDGTHRVHNEGDIGVGLPGPYEIAYGSLVPKRGECANLLVTVCVSASHIAFGSIRMEPVFMILGQSAATAASLALDEGIAVQDVEYDKLREVLIADGQVLEIEDAIFSPPVRLSDLDGIVLDDNHAILRGQWTRSRSLTPYVEQGYRHDNDVEKENKSARYEVELEEGAYEVRISYTQSSNRATNVPVIVYHVDGEDTVLMNQRREPEHDGLFTSVGVFRFSEEAPAAVEIHAAGTDGHVVIDAVQWLLVDEEDQ